MIYRFKKLALTCLLLPYTFNLFASEEIIKIGVRGYEYRFTLINTPDASAALIMAPGGRKHWNAEILSDGTVAYDDGKKNFQIEERKRFSDHGLIVAVIGQPDDIGTMYDDHRISTAHAEEIKLVADEIRRIANVPVWVMGHSMGGYSAANAAIRLGDTINGLVLANVVTEANEKWDTYETHPEGVLNMPLDQIQAPTLSITNLQDSCYATPPEGMRKVHAKLTNAKPAKLVELDDDSEGHSSCGSYGAHGYLGIREKVIKVITDFIHEHSKP